MRLSRRLSHALEFAGVRLALSVATLFPIGAARAVGSGLGWFAFSVLRLRRRVALDNVTRALGVDEVEGEAIVKRSYQNLGRSLMEFIALYRLRADGARRLMRIEGFEHVEAALRDGRGLIFISGHLGMWEYIGAGLTTSDVPASFLVGQQSNSRVDGLMNELRQRGGVEIVGKGMALKHVLRALRENRVVGMLADQDAGRNGVFVDFLGRPASTARGPAMFAIRQKCPVLCGYVRRTEEGKLVMTCEPPVWPDPDEDEETSVRRIMQHCASSLARMVRTYPDQYFWGHRRWKTRPDS